MSKKNQSEINEIAWKACDTFRGVVDPSDYKNYILVMLFGKYISDLWQDHHDRYMQEYKGDLERVQRRLARERFRLPAGCSFYDLHQQRDSPDIGERMDIALAKIEEENKSKLKEVFREVNFNNENKLGQTKERNVRLKNLLNDFADPRLNLRPSIVGDEDIIGNVYEYLLERFASGAGKKAGEFYTPAKFPPSSPCCSSPKKATPSAIPLAVPAPSSSKSVAKPTNAISSSTAKKATPPPTPFAA